MTGLFDEFNNSNTFVLRTVFLTFSFLFILFFLNDFSKLLRNDVAKNKQ